MALHLNPRHGAISGGECLLFSLSYNTDSRPSSSSTRISAGGHVKSYEHSYTYDDDDGRLKTIAYPSGITASYGYNAHGYLATVDDTATTGVLETYNALDAYGNVTQVTYGNGVKTQRAFAANSGRPTDIDSTRGSTTVLQDNEYQWQSNGQLQSRISHVGSMNARKEDFVYDHLNRLESAKTYLNGGTNASRTLETTYYKLGNIKSKTSSVTADVGVTGYGYGSGTAAPGHHAVTSASIGGNAHTFSYDADGNMTQYDCTPATCEDKYIGWNKRNLPTTVTLGDSLTDTTPMAKDEFAYGPNGQRYYKKSTWDDAGTLRTEHTYYVGRFEEVLPGDQPDYSSIMKTRVTDSLLHVRTMATVGGTVVSAMEYLHRDHLGSVEAVTDAGGASLLVQAYDPFGERRKSDWMGMLSASERQTLADNQPLKTSRGYTGHEHLDRTGFIHMNGRLYDPQLGRFLSPDPIVAAPGSSQSWNSYSYVSNSPLSYVDPGGQFQAGIGCNVGYVMCMNGGGNTSGGGGGSSQGSETATIRTFKVHIGVIFARVPVLRDPIGSVFGRGGGINDDPNGGINSDVYFGGLLSVSFRVISNFFISITSNTETRQIQTSEEEQSPASRPMGAGAQQGAAINLNFSEGTKRVSEANDKYDVTNLVSEEFPDGTHNINIQIDPSIDSNMRVPDKNTILVNPNWLKKVNLKILGSSLGHELIHVNDYIRGRINRYEPDSVRASEHRAYLWQYSTRRHFKLSDEYKTFVEKKIVKYRR